MFGVVPRVLWSQQHEPDDQGRILLALRSLLIQSDELCIVVDTGVGDLWSQKESSRFGINLERQRLLEALAEKGVSPEDVTDVILTHLHMDHAGGVARRGASGKIELTFPNATHHLQRKNLENASNPSPRERASYPERCFEPLMESGQLNLLEHSGSLFPGIELLLSDGHTSGQQLVLIRGGDEDPLSGLLYCADLIPTHSHVPLLWHMAYDMNPSLLLEEKALITEQAEISGWALFYEHDPRQAASMVEKTGGGYKAGAAVEL